MNIGPPIEIIEVAPPASVPDRPEQLPAAPKKDKEKVPA